MLNYLLSEGAPPTTFLTNISSFNATEPTKVELRCDPRLAWYLMKPEAARRKPDPQRPTDPGDPETVDLLIELRDATTQPDAQVLGLLDSVAPAYLNPGSTT